MVLAPTSMPLTCACFSRAQSVHRTQSASECSKGTLAPYECVSTSIQPLKSQNRGPRILPPTPVKKKKCWSLLDCHFALRYISTHTYFRALAPISKPALQSTKSRPRVRVTKSNLALPCDRICTGCPDLASKSG